MKQVQPAVDGDTLEAKIESAPSVEELEAMQPSIKDMFEQTEAATRWYNTAPYTAAKVFIEAARSSERFRQDLLENDRHVLDEKHEPTGEGWESTMREECPKLNREINNMRLSAAQGGWGEQLAVRVLNK